jgi:hypothetical protein
MWRGFAIVVPLAVVACGGTTRPASRAGDQLDEGGGALARASMQLLIGSDDRKHGRDEEATGSLGGDAYGGGMYGGAAYGGWSPLQWSYGTAHVQSWAVPPTPSAADLPGVIEGTVTWQGAPPSAVLSTCAPLMQPTVHVGRDRRMSGVLVFIEKLAVGRALPASALANVGAVIAKRGCAYLPTAQIAAPMPATVTVYGDTTHARLRVGGSGLASTYDLQEAGRVQLAVPPGVVQIDSDDGRSAAAWVVTIDSPAYAITDDSGHFRIDELAEDTYDVTFWQAPIARVSPDGVLTYGPPIVAHRRVRVDGTRAAHVDVALVGK